MPPITGKWAEALKPEFSKEYYKELYAKVREEYARFRVYPPASDLFSAFHMTPMEEVKAVILGQDPYHEEGQAHGLCFSVRPGIETPPSLKNIYRELETDVGCYIPNNGYLEKWARQGVLLLNTVLSQGPPGQFPQEYRLGAVYRRGAIRAGQGGQAHGFPALGKPRAGEKSHPFQPGPSGAYRTASESFVGAQGIFRLQAFFTDQRISGTTSSDAH